VISLCNKQDTENFVQEEEGNKNNIAVDDTSCTLCTYQCFQVKSEEENREKKERKKERKYLNKKSLFSLHDNRTVTLYSIERKRTKTGENICICIRYA
jgi:hypothetical protein